MLKNRLSSIKGATLLELIVAISLSTMLLGITFETTARIRKLTSQIAKIEDVQNQISDLYRLLSHDFQFLKHTGCRMHKVSSFGIPNMTIDHHVLMLTYIDMPTHDVFRQVSEDKLLLSNHGHMPLNRFVFISDCFHGEVMQIKKTWVQQQYQVILTQQPLTKTYDHHAEVSPIVSKKYFLKPRGKLASLYLSVGQDAPVEVVENIDSFDMRLMQNTLKISGTVWKHEIKKPFIFYFHIER